MLVVCFRLLFVLIRVWGWVCYFGFGFFVWLIVGVVMFGYLVSLFFNLWYYNCC